MDRNASHPASYRDPAGHLFFEEGQLYRQVNSTYQPHFDHLISSGLYTKLAGDGLLIPHEEVTFDAGIHPEWYRLLRPELLPFISYPQEWCFSQWKEAALLTLQIAETSLQHGMVLKDASAFNVQFRQGKPIFIDTLSFEILEESRPWVAYRQFCEHFLAPLALMSLVDIRLQDLVGAKLEGIPLDLAGRLLPASSRFRLPLLMHLHMHSRSQKAHAGQNIHQEAGGMNLRSHLGLIDSLQGAISSLAWEPSTTVWGSYQRSDSYTDEANRHKHEIIGEWLQKQKQKVVWDLGANDGAYSQLACDSGSFTVSIDSDAGAVERCYREMRQRGETRLYPLRADIGSPTPGLGWENQERTPLLERAHPDLILALALVHHLALGQNIPLPQLARLMAKLSSHLLIEFVPITDPQAQRLLASKVNIFPDYTQYGFEDAFCEHFCLDERLTLRGSQRILYRMSRKSSVR